VAFGAAAPRPCRDRVECPISAADLCRPTSVMPRRDDAMFYQLYFQTPGLAEAELQRDVRATIVKLLYSASGDVPHRAGAGGGSDISRQHVHDSALPAWDGKAWNDNLFAKARSKRELGDTKLVLPIELRGNRPRIIALLLRPVVQDRAAIWSGSVAGGKIGLRKGNEAHANWLDHGAHVIEGRNTMKKHILTLAICAFILACSPPGASAEEGIGDHGHCHGMMGHGGMMGGGMMGRGAGMRVIFALMDSDGDGTVSLQEFQAAHEKIFKAMDTDKEGTLSLEEILAFMRGTGKSGPKEHDHERE
jgi:hypothetical protein